MLAAAFIRYDFGAANFAHFIEGALMRTKLTQILLVTVLVLTAGASPVTAQFDDLFLLSLDTLPYDNCQRGYFGQSYAMNLILWNSTSPTGLVSGFECRLLQEGFVQVTGLEVPGQGFNLGTATNLIVGYAEPVLVAEATILATITYVVVDSPTATVTPPVTGDKASPICGDAQSSFSLVPTLKPSLPGLMAYVYPDGGNDILVPAGSISGGVGRDFLVDVIPVATDVQSWGSVKALYRTP